MRIRQVKPAFWTDVKLRGIPLEARLVFIGLWMEADDAGFLRWDPPQIAFDLFPDLTPEAGEAMIHVAGVALSERGRIRIFKTCGHAVIPKLADHQRLAGATHRVYTFETEHKTCSANRARPRGSPRVPAVPRPVRSGQVRSGQVNSRARAGEQNGVTTIEEHDAALARKMSPTEEADTWLALVRNPNINGKSKERAARQLRELGWEEVEGQWQKA